MSKQVTNSKRVTPDNIVQLNDDEIFVFGSNTLGIHGRGAALHAKKFGAKHGIGEGLSGKTCAFPTLNATLEPFRLQKRTHNDLAESVENFCICAEDRTNMIFLLTKVGCGLAGYDEDYMKKFFEFTPHNVIKPAGW